MAGAPTSVKVVVFPADGTNTHFETIETVKVDIKPSTRPSLPLLRTTMEIIHDTRNIVTNLPNRFLPTTEQLEAIVGSEANKARATELKDRIETNSAREIREMDNFETLAAHTHTVAHFDETAWYLQPAISLLPDIRATRKWDDEQWNQRAVLQIGTENTYHVFITRSKDRSSPNPVLPVVSGDVFLLKISDTEDQDGRRFYQDVKDECLLRDLGYMLSRLAALR